MMHPTCTHNFFILFSLISEYFRIFAAETKSNMAQIDDFFMYENRVEGITNTYDHEKHPFSVSKC